MAAAPVRTEHDQAIASLRSSYEAIPAGSPVRLAKPTSNLFRPRSGMTAPGLDVSGLTGVLAVDPVTRTAEVQGMCTYETLVDATLAHGLMPLVVPQLRTITIGGAVSGLGIESTSFRNGMPHESVLEMDVFTGAGEVVTTRPGDALFDAVPNSYGSLGYVTRLLIELERAPAFVALRHLRFSDTGSLAATIADICATRSHDGAAVDGLDGVAFAPGEYYLTLATWTDAPSGPVSDYTGQQIYYRSIRSLSTDQLTGHDYLWRWDTDWFWCSRAFGVQHPLVRRLWPRRWRRSDVYHRLVGLDRRTRLSERLDALARRPRQERVIQDVEVPVERVGEFLTWFDDAVGMRPVWLCPLRLRATGGPGARPWPTYPLRGGTTYVNVGFWGAVPVGPDAPLAPRNRAIEEKVQALGGHKSLYSEAFYDRDTFERLYGGANLAAVKARYDPDNRLTSLYEKAVEER
ncbi:FAD-binding oxidoreductase [Tessaracoccus sp. MC1865]|nr:FAD-binding oxidoreductase [Tessaracoccus sp. MC1865]